MRPVRILSNLWYFTFVIFNKWQYTLHISSLTNFAMTLTKKSCLFSLATMQRHRGMSKAMGVDQSFAAPR